MAKYLITGGAGFIGSNICKELVDRGEDVVIIDNFITGRKSNIEPFLKKITLIEGDVANEKDISKALQGVDYVVHLAALNSVPRSIKDPLASHYNNTTASLQLFNCAKDSPTVKRIIFSSSSSLYGMSKEFPKVETIPRQPLSFYALQKAMIEEYARLFHELYGLEIICLRFFNVFGPNQDPNSEYSAVIPKFITMMNKGETPTIFGDGETSRDFTYIANVVDGVLKACVAPGSHGGEVFNLACGGRYTLNKLVSDLNDVLGTSIEPKYADFRLGDIRHSHADISKAKKAFGFEPSVSFIEGLRLTAAHLLEDAPK